MSAEGGGLFNQGFVGQGFNWWIGQVADDSYWRDNINPGKFKDKQNVPGWGYFYLEELTKSVRMRDLIKRRKNSFGSYNTGWDKRHG